MTVKAIDLFAGAGGFTCAAHDAGVEVIAAIEFDQEAANTYRTNFIERQGRNIQLFNEDINDVDPKTLRESLNLNVGELDMILGGPPCQGFSTHRINNSGVNDPRNQLLLRYFEFVHEFQPKCFLVENVSGLLWERHRPFLNKFLRLAKKEGYRVVFKNIVNARDYGVPQNRKRVFIYCVRRDTVKPRARIKFPPESTHGSPRNKKKLPVWNTASTVFEPIPNEMYQRFIEDYFQNKTNLSNEEAYELLQGLVSGDPIRENDPCNIYMIPSEDMVRRFEATPLNGSRLDAGEEFMLDCHKDYEGHKDVYGRVFIHTPSNTITTGCNNPSKGRFVHPWLNHGMTLRHAARLQTFPDSFDFVGSTTDMARQIGNAVPPLLGKILISDICSRLN
ncbi:DNA cytosine methyltransferase [Vibrio fluvialis]|uniref:DNA cytosine methyltransferase n=1 Tax=Vibrio fluvialis TaxID=676 RepID=UPI001EEB6828|nr:DNA cytosine methyltransferase [Vibrio fluvialis]EMC0408451.1 DNA cytosine methyltransferase [Vibrio fluvialis]MCG6348598.1 DNA cytosine methyltransferase [Vibrio fluvialis]